MNDRSVRMVMFGALLAAKHVRENLLMLLASAGQIIEPCLTGVDSTDRMGTSVLDGIRPTCTEAYWLVKPRWIAPIGGNGSA